MKKAITLLKQTLAITAFLPLSEGRAVLITLAITAFLPLSGGRAVHAAEPTLYRLAFWVPPERMIEFEQTYKEKVAPLLKRHGFVESSKKGRATPDNVFARMFEFKNHAERLAVTPFFQGPLGQKMMRELGKTFGTLESSGLIKWAFRHYRAPAGSGKVLHTGPGRGHWRTFDGTDGLGGGQVINVYEDKDGNLWVNTAHGGISKYDGRKFTNFTTKDGLSHNRIRSFYQDRQGNIWFGTSRGAVKYDGKTFSSLTKKDGLPHNTINRIYQDQEGNFWFTTGGSGVCKYDGKTFTTLTTKDGLVSNTVRRILEDRKGNFWFTSRSGVSRYDGENFTNFTTQNGLPKNDVRDIIQDQNGDFLFATWGGGVCRYDGENFNTLTTRDGLLNDRVLGIFQDPDGILWFATWGGVSRHDGEIFTDFTTEDGLAMNETLDVHRGQEGHLWFAASGGLSRYDDRTFISFNKMAANNALYRATEDQEDNIWFTTWGGGVTRYDGRTFLNFTAEDGLPHNTIRAVMVDDGKLWFGTARGLAYYDGETFTTFSEIDGLGGSNSSNVWSMIKDREGNYWFGTGGGVSRYDGTNWTTFTTDDSLAGNRVWSIIQDQDGFIWFGTDDRGASRYDGKTFTTFTTTDGLPDNSVECMFQDRDGYIWFGTNAGGASRYDGDSFKTFTKHDGLASNTVTSISQDRAGHLWFATQGGGVTRFDGETFVTLTEKDGLLDNQVAFTLQDRHENYWFGTARGLTRYRPPDRFPPKISIDAVVADQRYHSVAEVAFASTTEFLVFEFHGIDFKTRPEAMVYRYRLKGYDEDWNTTNVRRAEYQNLPRGNYTFEVVAVDRDLVYSATPATVAITVHMPYERASLFSALGIAIILVAWQTARVIRRDHRLHEANSALSGANHELFDLNRNLREKSKTLEEKSNDLEEKTAALETQNVQLTEAQKAADIANQAKSRFLASMSHELRTPLNGILGYAQILTRSKDLSEKHFNGVNIIRRSGEHLLGLIEEVLDLARIEADKVEMEEKEIRLPAFLKNIAAINEVRAQEKGITFTSKTHPDLPKGVLGDPKRLRQVLDNLLGNAIKFTHKGEVVFGIDIVSRSKNRVQLLFEVRDTGVGLSKEEAQEIFKPFEQAGDIAQKAGGTGLGLAISQKIVGLMGGEIQVESEPRKGSRFYFEIELPEVTTQVVQETQDERLPIAFQGRTRHVLVADDNRENRSFLVDLLEPLGFEIQEAETGQEALTRANNHTPDLILMDLIMPELDGLEATKRIRQSDTLQGVAVLGLSASVFEHAREGSIQAGCDDFVPKPVQASELLDKIGQHLSLQWIYEEGPNTDMAPLIAPPSETLTSLYKFAQKGQIRGIQEEIEQLVELGENFSPFVSKIKTMVRGFQLEELCDFLKPHLDEERT